MIALLRSRGGQVPLHGDVDRFTRSGGMRGGRPTKESSWPPTSHPPDRAPWPTSITAQEIHPHLEGADRVPSAQWCAAVKVFARGAEPLAGNCSPVAGQ